MSYKIYFMVQITKDKAETYHIDHPISSYGIFCFNNKGDLFLQSDWGLYGYSWRAFGKNFKEFIAQCEPDYILQKFFINFNEIGGKKDRWRSSSVHVRILIIELIKELKNEISATNTI